MATEPLTTVSDPSGATAIAFSSARPWYVRLRGVARQKPLGTFGAIILFIFIVSALFGTDLNIAGTTLVPGFSPYAPQTTEVANKQQAPTLNHPFGTDDLGRDVFARVVSGARTAMIIGIAATGLSLLVGTMIGMVSAYFGGTTDLLIQRVMDAIMSLPPLILLLVLVTVLTPSQFTVIMVLIVFITPSTSRVIRGSTLVIKEMTYVEAAKAIGATPTRIMTRHILPNVVAPILVLSSVLIGATISTEAALSFLGLGAHTATSPTWGFMLNEAVTRGSLDKLWWMSIVPGVAITLTVLSFNLLGDALRDVLDPRLRGTGAGAS